MFFPLIAAPAVDLYKVAAGRNTLLFLVFVTAAIMPVTLGYTIFGFRVFHDGVRPDSPTDAAPAAPSSPGA
jgi:cytochrome bd-type quinol oxidase subunit 2